EPFDRDPVHMDGPLVFGRAVRIDRREANSGRKAAHETDSDKDLIAEERINDLSFILAPREEQSEENQAVGYGRVATAGGGLETHQLWLRRAGDALAAGRGG